MHKFESLQNDESRAHPRNPTAHLELSIDVPTKQ